MKDPTDPVGDPTEESPCGRELCIRFSAFSEEYAIVFVGALEHQTEASRLNDIFHRSEPESGITWKKKFEAKKLREKSHLLAAC